MSKMSETSSAAVQPNVVRLSEFLARNQAVQFIRLQWLDYTCTLRARVLTARHFRTLVETGQYHEIGRGYLSLPDDSGPLYGGDASMVVGKNALMPDFESLRLCPWATGHASVMCFYGEGHSQQDEHGELRPVISALCPRNALRKALQRAATLRLRFRIGMEIEFVVVSREPDGTMAPLPRRAHQASSIRTLETTMWPILDEITSILEAVGIPVQHYQSEGGQSQFELATAPLPPMQAADAIVFAREVIRVVCARRSLVATVHPFCTTLGSGAHTHLSLDTVPDEGIEDMFLAGVLEHLKALCAFGMPVPVSYKRVAASACATGRYVAWGTQNRETPVRKMGPGWWELRMVDGLAHIYLFLASVIVSGCAGVTQRSRLVLQDCTGEIFGRGLIPRQSDKN